MGSQMTSYEYRVIPAPDRAAKSRKKGADPFAETLSEVFNKEATDGWEFQRAETLPLRERTGLTGTRSGFRTLLIFRRAKGIDDAETTSEALKLLENREDWAE